MEEKYTVKFTSDCYLHGADGMSVQIRVAPIKALFRFYFRIIEGSKYSNSKDLLLAEKELFGGVFLSKDPEKKDEPVKSRLRIWIDDIGSCAKPTNTEKALDSYLGYGLNDKMVLGKIQSFPAESSFVIGLDYPDEYVDVVHEIIFLCNCFGGLGGRSRKGLGSVVFSEIKGKTTSLKDIAKDWSDCYLPENKKKDFPWMIGKDSHGVLAWESKNRYESLNEAIVDLQWYYKNALRNEYKELLGYSKGKERMASPLVFKIGMKSNSFVIRCVHYPYCDNPRNGEAEKLSWENVHKTLDSGDSIFKRM